LEKSENYRNREGKDRESPEMAGKKEENREEMMEMGQKKEAETEFRPPFCSE
jgi:hypothetical protein